MDNRINPLIYSKLDELEKAIKEIKIDIGNYDKRDSWRRQVENKAGWYFIKTDMPIKEMMRLKHDNVEGHINILKT